MCAILMALFLPVVAFAQNITVKGTVTDELDSPVISATVVVVGQTNKGALTDPDGNFTIADIPANATLRISYIGYKTQEIALNGRTTLAVKLVPDSELLDEVVVTALGIKRSQKALSYNVQELKSDALTTSKDANFINSLNGKVAGLNINASSAGVGGATKVVMRGTKSVEGSNNALYVIDGVPMFSTTGAQGSGRFDSQGTTEGMADINPDDIASISVLTGASAAALYGSAAANGAILITTKKGASGAVRVSYSLNADWGTPFILPPFQNRYGNDGDIQSWGHKLADGEDRFNVEDFFRTASNMTHSLSVSGGSEMNQTYVSASVTNASGLIPNNAYNRYNFGARNTTQLLEKRLTLDASANYIIQYNRNFINQGEYGNPLAPAYLMPRGDSNAKVKNFEKFDPGKGYYVQNWGYGDGDYTLQNPYWVAYRNLRETKRERYMLSFNASYDILKWSDSDKWSISGRIRTDATNILGTDKRFDTTSKVLSPDKSGFYGELKGTDRQTYGDLITTVNKEFELDQNNRLNLNATLGTSIQDTRYDASNIQGPLKNDGIPNEFNIFNINQGHGNTSLVPSGWIEQTQSIFASAELGWNSYLYLTLTGRNDWASQLANSPQKSFFYPSVGLSAVITEMLNDEAKAASRNVLPYLKVRASYASVASPFQRGLTSPTYGFDPQSKTYKSITFFPVGQLYPERTNSYELGFSSRWFKGLLTMDATYYLTNTTNQTIFSSVAAGSGYSGIYIQTGNVRNQGVELALGLHLGQEDGVLFDSNFTLGYNKNEIMELAENYTNPITGQKESKEFLQKGSIEPLSFILKTGGTLGDLYTNSDFRRDATGRIVVGNDGGVNTENLANGERLKLGSVLPDYTWGWNNEFTYKGFSVGALVSGRVGGIVVSMTEAAMDHYGVSEASAAARDLGYVEVDGLTIDPHSYYFARGKNRLAQYYTYDATNIRLSEAHIGYRLPRKYLWNVVDVTLSLYGRNLAFLYSKAPFDPESVSSTGNYAQGVDYFMLPSQRTFGLNLKLNF
ncbi:MAG: SusC/RagA family TonB-linked outer membrane protein, partial [Porphyromonas sp.]|nr:SusC/RagA family TonB-linked outer membrane protein [Porphyromonas sp.]